MLRLHIEDKELWDEQREIFINIKGCDLILEHSLVSISKWESKYHKPFLSSEKSPSETLDYIKMMVIGKMPEDEKVFTALSQSQIGEIANYINDPMTATVINEEDEKEITNGNSSKFVTSEEIYSWMCAQGVPAEYQYWHINRLIILLKICAIHNKPKDKKKKRMTSSDLALRRARMEAARAKYKKP